jgi:ZIP family zinc transporter
VNWIVLFSIGTFFSTLLGGLFALRYQDRLHRILGFSAGVLLGIVAFDILPEIFRLVGTTRVPDVQPMLALVIGFLVFHGAEKLVAIHQSREGEYGGHHHPYIGVGSAMALIAHSFLDGVGIGLAFQISKSAGVAVAVAVIAHDFCDGLNTVSLLLVHRGSSRKAFVFLALDAVAPILGALCTNFLHVSDVGLLMYLGFFAGFLLYIGVSDILPEAHSKQPSGVTLALTAGGALFAFLVTRVA